MATQYVRVHLNMDGNEIQDVLAQKLEEHPLNPSAGQFYYNTVDNTLYVYNGTEWLDALSQKVIYSEGEGIDITNNVVSIDLATNENAGNITLTKANGLAANAPIASTSQAGLIEIATDLEASTGTSELLAVNPKQLATKVPKLSTSPVSGTYTKLTINSNGLVTSGTTLLASDIPSLNLSKISDVTATAAEVNVLDGITASTAELNIMDGVTVTTSDINSVVNKIGLTNLSINSDSTDYLGYNNSTGKFSAKVDTTVGTVSTNLITSGAVNTALGNKLDKKPDGTNNLIGTDNKITATYLPELITVTGVKGNAEATYRTGNVNITADNVLPLQANNSGKFLTTNGSTASWATVDALPSQAGYSGKFLTTNGTSASWADAVTSSSVINALGYTPYNSTNPSGYQANVIEVIKVNNTEQTITNKAVNISVPTDTADLTNGAGFLVSSDLEGYATESYVNSQGFITGIDSSDVTTALGYTPYDSSNPNGYISGITSSDVTTALGYTPYNSSNPNGYQANVIETIKVNNVAQTVTSKAVNITVPTQPSDIGAVPTSRTINNKALTSDITLTSSDVGALSSSTTINDLTTSAQQDALNSGATTTNIGQIATNTNSISAINEKIPTQASSNNQLADKEFVNSSIATNTANFIGTFASVQELNNYSGTVTNNDYAFVTNSVITDNGNDWSTFSALDAYSKSLLTNFDYAWVINGSNFDLYRFDIVNQEWVLRVQNTAKADVTLNTAYNRYKATVSGSTITWDYEYTLNNSSFTAAQWAAINSGITSGDVTLIQSAIQPNDNISELTNDSGYITGITSSDVTTALGYTPYNSTNPNGYQANVIEAIKVNGTTQTITSKSVDITVPTDTSDLTNGAGYITGITSTDVTTALGYTPYDSSNPSGYTTNVGTVTSVNSTSPDSNGNVSITIPTDTSDLTNGAGFITSSALTDYVTLNTDQNITGTKTYVGQKKIGFKQSSSSDKLGFTLYNNSGTEKGYLEFNPGNTVDSVPLMTLGNYATASAGLTHVGFRKYSNISGASGAYNLLAPLISDAKTPFSLTTTYTNFYLPLGFKNGNTTVTTAKTGVVDLGSLFTDYVTSSGLATTLADYALASSVPTKVSDLVNDSGYITGITSSDVTSALGYTPYDSSNPSGYITGISSSDVTTALGYTPYNSSNPAGYISGITSSDVTTALGYTPYNSSNPSGYITGISSSDVTTALGYTPYNSTNPSGYQANVIETIKVNGTAQTVTSKAVDISVPTDTSDLTNGAGYITGITSSDVTTALGYTPENVNNKTTIIDSNSTDTQYPSAKSVYNNLTTKADIQLSNLDVTGENRLHSLKGYLENGQSYTDTTLYNDVYSYNHSTFDKSKFTVVGTPTITDDGIATFTYNGYLSKNISLDITKKLVFYGSFVHKTADIGQTILEFKPDNIRLTTYTNRLNFSMSPTTGTTVFQNGQTYYYKAEYSNGIWNIYLLVNGSYVLDLNTTGEATSATVFSNNITSINIGANTSLLQENSNRRWQGSIDLKAFSITVNGYPVFSGNITGIDTIKSADYTVVGTGLTITNDGIASGFSASDYFTTKVLSTLSNIQTFKILSKSRFTSLSGGSTIFGLESKLRIIYNANNQRIELRYVTTNTTWENSLLYIPNITIETNKYYYIGVEYDGNYINLLYSIDGKNWTVASSRAEASGVASVSTLGIGRNYNGTGYLYGDLDLNLFKIFVDGNLVYQPCLFIPYAESSTGSKIVDVAYRDRVIDVYEQYGSANYYTIDETNKNCTLPMGEVYGLIEKKADISILSSYEPIANVASKGSATQPIYFDSNGVAQNTTYTLAKSVPSDAVFTDTKNTAGSTDTSSKIFLVGATSQAANPQTYSHDTVFVDGSGFLNSSNPNADTNNTVVATTKWVTDKGYLTSHQTIKQDGITGATVNRYGSCSTGASTAAKTVSITTGTFNLETGAKVTVKFTNANTADSPTLNVNSKGAKNIFHNGAQITTGDNKALLAGTCDFVYDGTQWQLIGNYIDTNTTYANGTGITIGTGNAINHSNSVTAGTAGTSSATSGSTLDVPYVTYDAQGHVTATGTHTHTVTGFATTDTKNTAGSTDTSSKIFLVGATSQAANPQTYSHDTAFVDTSGQLNSANPAASTNSTVVATTKWVTDKGYLTSHQTIKVNGVTGATTNNYGACSTAAGTAQKDVTLTAGTFNLETGARVVVKFANTNTAANPTLKVGSTTAKAIQYRGSAITAGYLAANRTYEFVYDGTNYQLIGDINTDTDTKTAQNISTTDNTYPMLLGYTANATANIGNQPTLFGSGIKANPSTSQVVANSYAFGANATMQYNSNTEAIEFVFP